MPVELIWDGKYDAQGKRVQPVRLALPFQTIETINESSQQRQQMLDMFSGGKETDWRNRLIWGDKKYVLPSLMEEFRGKVDLIYIDPPFATGADFSFTAQVPEDETGSATTFVKQPSILEQKAYRDTWGRGLDGYLQWFYETTQLLKDLLSDKGSVYVHIDDHVSHYVKAILDEVFGVENFVNEIIWKRASTVKGNVGQGVKFWDRNTESILFYSNGGKHIFNNQFTEYENNYLEKFYKYKDNSGRVYRLISMIGPGGESKGNPTYEIMGVKKSWRYSRKKMAEFIEEGLIVQTSPGAVPQKKQFLDEGKGVSVQTLWDDIEAISPTSLERANYPTQKPEALLERIIKASSNPGDLVLDCFCGSGTTAAVAEKLGRRWITCDLGRFAIHTARKRLLSIDNVKPFVVQNLGKYERQAWQAAEWDDQAAGRAREAAYREFILRLYGAQTLPGGTWTHGLKAGRLVHVGAVDAPVTVGDLKAIVREVFVRAGAEGAAASADVLGWDFAFELNETGLNMAREAGVDIKFRKIPREVLEKKAVDAGDIRFFELGALSVGQAVQGQRLTLTLQDFLMPQDDIPADIQRSITHWSQLVDYWAVDWDFRGDTFHNQWQAYRTRKASKLELSARHEYPARGRYTVLVKVIDLLGNDTTKTLSVEVI
ncbi:DNA methyltransferase [Deinococcus sp.]|uniref:DNA methyltransferase n=1 Tax=Deinococcus sp. TaxID=47478 RepID=UPI003CC5980D